MTKKAKRIINYTIRQLTKHISTDIILDNLQKHWHLDHSTAEEYLYNAELQIALGDDCDGVSIYHIPVQDVQFEDLIKEVAEVVDDFDMSFVAIMDEVMAFR